MKCQVVGCPNEAKYLINAEWFEIKLKAGVCKEHVSTIYKMHEDKLEQIKSK